jgi:hypothetical protein
VKRRSAVLAALAAFGLVAAVPAYAGQQQYDQLSASVRAGLSAMVSDDGSPEPVFPSEAAKISWLTVQTERLEKRMPNIDERVTFLKTVHYEATRAGLDPELVLGLIQAESAFRKYAVSSAGALGLMQVMPFWVKQIGRPADNLFHLRTNLRYGCTILRHYLDKEGGNLFLALGRYNGSRGRSEYPNTVLAYWTKWRALR